MIFRPCIDIHDGKVKQIVGASLKDGESVVENFVSQQDSRYFANLFKSDGLTGGHIIMLGKSAENKAQALAALKEYPGGMQIGGGITDENATEYIDAGASHVIVTSYVFDKTGINYDNLKKLVFACSKEKIVLDLSAKEINGKYFVAADRWQTVTDIEISESFLQALSSECDEFLVHAVNKEGKKQGIDAKLISILASSPVPVTYAGGISDYEDIEKIKEIGRDRVDFTVGSALDIFGGYMEYDLIKKYKQVIK